MYKGNCHYIVNINDCSREVVGSLVNAIVARCDEVTVNYENGVLEYSQQLMNRVKSFRGLVFVTKRGYTVHGILPLKPNIDDRPLMQRLAELICRVNKNMEMGSIFLDMDTGDIRYRNFVECSEAVPSVTLVMKTLHYAYTVLECYAGGIAALINGVTMQEAISTIARDQERKRIEVFLMNEKQRRQGRFIEKINFMEKRLQKIYIQVYKAEFLYENGNKHSHKKAYRDYIVPELDKRFGPQFPESEGWMRLYRDVDYVREPEYNYLIKKGNEEIHFRRAPGDSKELELYARLYDENLLVLEELLSQPFRFTKIGPLQSEKQLVSVPLHTAKSYCWSFDNMNIIKKVLLDRIADPGCKRKRLEELCEDLAWGDACVLPEVFCPTPSEPAESCDLICFELLENLYNVVKHCLGKMQHDGQIILFRRKYQIANDS